MENKVPVEEEEVNSDAAIAASVSDSWSSCYFDDDIMKQPNELLAEEAAKIPYVGDKARRSIISV